MVYGLEFLLSYVGTEATQKGRFDSESAYFTSNFLYPCFRCNFIPRRLIPPITKRGFLTTTRSQPRLGLVEGSRGPTQIHIRGLCHWAGEPAGHLGIALDLVLYLKTQFNTRNKTRGFNLSFIPQVSNQVYNPGIFGYYTCRQV